MSSGDHPKKPGGWRQGGKGGGDAGGGARPPGRSDGPAWRRGGGDIGSVPSVSSRGVKLTIGIGTLIALLVGLLVLIVMFRPQTPATIFTIGAHYADVLAVPPNVHGWRALVELNEWTKEEQQKDGAAWLQLIFGSRHVFTPQQEPTSFTAAGMDQLQADLARARDKGTVVIVLSAHAAVDERGVFFIPAKPRVDGATLLDPEVRIHLTALLDLIRKAVKPSQDKVLVLDIAPMPAWTPLGILHNDVAAELRNELAKLSKNDRLFVLASVDRDDSPWSSDELRSTAFLHTFLQGLRGGARHEGGANDGHITLAKLAEYVKREVNVWAQGNRSDNQHPMLLGGQPEEATAEPGATNQLTLETAREIYLRFSDVAPPERTAADLPSFERWRAAWERWHRLAQRQPPPWVYQPEAWRYATALLRRYEELLLAGSPDAESVLKLADGAMAKLEPAPEVTGSLRASLVAPTSLALTGPSLAEHQAEEAEDLKRVDRLLRASGEAFDTESKKVLAEVRDHELRFLVLLQRALLDRIRRESASGQAKAVADANEIMRRLGRSDQLPFEMQIVRLLRAYDLTGAPNYDPAVLNLLLQTEIAAGEAQWGRWDATLHSAQQRFFAGLQPALADADTWRRLGEDCFFAGDVDGARQRLQKALEKYQAIRAEQVLPLAKAQAVRDELSMRLPWISLWVAGPRDLETAIPNTREYADELNRTAAEVEKLWAKAHQLTQELQALGSAPRAEEIAQRPQRCRQVSALAEEAKADLDRLLALASAEAARLTDKARPREKTQTDWQATDNLLQLPFFPIQVREELLKRRGDISKSLHASNQGRDPKLQREDLAAKKRDVIAVKKAALRRARLLLAQIGPELMDEVAKFAAAENFGVQQQGVTAANLDEKQWQASLRRALQGVAKIKHKWPALLQKQLDLARTTDNLEQARAHLVLGERLGRLLDPACLPPGQAAPAAADDLRRLETALWLGAQGQRVVDDFWADGDRDAKGEPFFARVAGAVVDDAKRLLTPRGVKELPAGRAKGVADLEALLRDRQRAKLRITLAEVKPGDPLRWTTEPMRVLQYELAPEGQVPPGLPHARLASRPEQPWLRTAGGGKLFDLTGERKKAPEFVVEREEAKRRRGDEKELLRLETWYRGHRQTLTTDVQLYPEPDVAWMDQVAPAQGFLSVRMTPGVANRFGTANNGIVVILDCSGSMYDHKVPGKPRPAAEELRTSPDTRFHVAKESLSRMLGQIPENTQVSIWTFSQMLGAPRPARSDRGEPFLTPTGGDEMGRVNDTIRPLVPMGPWSAARAQVAKKQIDDLVAYNDTPLVRAILKAREDLRDVKGYKTIIVLTDGKDNRIKDDKESNPNGEGIPALLAREFGSNSAFKDIKLVILGFQLPQSEKAEAEREFKEPLKKLLEPGDFILVDQQDELDRILREACKRELRFKLQDATTGQDVPLKLKPLVEQTGRKDPARHELRAGSYRVVIQDFRQAFELGGGEHLLLDVDVGSGENLVFRRALWTDEMDKEVKEDAGWRLSIVHQASRRDVERDYWVTLEGMEGRQRTPADSLLQPMPRFVWHELRGAGPSGAPPRQLAWANLPLLPAATWHAHAQWRAKADVPAKQEWTAWFSTNNPPSFHSLTRRTTERFEEWQRRQRGPFPMEGSSDPVVLDNIALEKQALAELGDDPKQPRDYLVIRLTFPAGRPVFAQLNQRVPTLHAFYGEAGKYVGYFQIANVENSLEAVSFFNVEQLKGDRRGTRQIKLPLGPPASGAPVDPPFDVPR